jgi:hypothetical protein
MRETPDPLTTEESQLLSVVLSDWLGWQGTTDTQSKMLDSIWTKLGLTGTGYMPEDPTKPDFLQSKGDAYFAPKSNCKAHIEAYLKGRKTLSDGLAKRASDFFKLVADSAPSFLLELTPDAYQEVESAFSILSGDTSGPKV